MKKSEAISEKKSGVEGALREIQAKYGEGAIMKLGDARKVDVDVIPTGSLAVDMALGVGGVPRGRVIEIYGPESSGKTTLALHIVANAQKTGGLCAYVDAEHAPDPEDAMKIGVVFGNPETTTGGNALKFYASVRIEVRRAAQLKKGEDIIGNRTNVKIVKNKVAAPFRRAEFDIMYNEGISYGGDLINLGLKYELIKKSGASLSFKETRLGQGFENAKEFLRQNPKLAQELVKEIKDKSKGSN